MIEITNSSIIKLFNVLSIDNNVLSSTNIMIMIISIMTDASDVAMTISLIIFKNKLIKLKMMRVYKN